jgi:hypothetical protein
MEKYNRLSIIEIIPGKNKKVKCVCDCGNTGTYILSNVKSGKTKSCGCLYKESRGKQGFCNISHGHTGTAEYICWKSIKARCYNKNRKDFYLYGGRGIVVCDRWINSYQNFFIDMGKKPSPEYSIDRIDVNGNYEPSNCRWATPTEQRLNQRKTL